MALEAGAGDPCGAEEDVCVRSTCFLMSGSQAILLLAICFLSCLKEWSLGDIPRDCWPYRLSFRPGGKPSVEVAGRRCCLRTPGGEGRGGKARSSLRLGQWHTDCQEAGWGQWPSSSHKSSRAVPSACDVRASEPLGLRESLHCQRCLGASSRPHAPGGRLFRLQKGLCPSSGLECIRGEALA